MNAGVLCVDACVAHLSILIATKKKIDEQNKIDFSEKKLFKYDYKKTI